MVFSQYVNQHKPTLRENFEANDDKIQRYYPLDNREHLCYHLIMEGSTDGKVYY